MSSIKLYIYIYIFFFQLLLRHGPASLKVAPPLILGKGVGQP